MGRRLKPVTKDLIRKYFGKHVRIKTRWFADGFRVITTTGEILISDAEMTVVIGSDEIYRCATLLGHEIWGSITAHGSREVVMAWMTHGEACGVTVRPGVMQGWFWRSIFWLLAFYGVILAANDDNSGIVIAVGAAGMLVLMRYWAKWQARKLAQEIGYSFPRVHGNAGATSDEDLEREGWL